MSRPSPRSTRALFAEHPRLFAVLAVFFFVMVIYTAQLIDLQAVRPERYRDLAQDQSTATRPIAGFRGRLLDREGFVLAASTPTQVIIADPQLVEDPGWTAALLAPHLGTEASDIETRLLPSSPQDRFNVVATTADATALAGIRALVADTQTSRAFTGIVIRPEEDRLYPAGELARPLIGRVDPDELGRSGIELQFDEVLRGTEGLERFERGRFGSISVGQRSIQPAERGTDLTLTLDHRIQFGTEAILKDTCEKLGAQGATAIVSDPTTGDVYAMASIERTGDTTCGVASSNKAAIDTFEPGSVMKLVSFAAAADRLGYTADEEIMVPGAIEVSDHRFADHPRHDDQMMSLSDAMGQSSNVATITLSQQMGKEVYYDYATRFGFGNLTGLGLKGESTGVLRKPSEWKGSDAGSIVIGQGMTVNLMQLAG
ncbi:MAG: peptidoglycan D,D-transpeptidase FtsI family protein, partial [Acidimicrobiia bacterium]